LSPGGYFSPGDWVYEHMCLELPHKQLCDAQCPGISLNDAEETESQKLHRTVAGRLWQHLNGNCLRRLTNN